MKISLSLRLAVLLGSVLVISGSASAWGQSGPDMGAQALWATPRQVLPLKESQLAKREIKVASVQITGPWLWFGPRTDGDPAGWGRDAADALLPYIEKAGREKLDLIAFPELYLGYFRVPSPSTEKIAKAAAAAGVYVAVGCLEVLDDRGSFTNSTLLFDREGKVVGRYAKTHPAVGEPPYLWPPLPDDAEWLMAPGQEFPVFDCDFGRVGILTCYDGYFPEAWRILGLKGAEVILWPNARGGAVEDYIVRTASHFNVAHVITSNKAIGAGTMICEWPGRISAQLDTATEGMVTATLPMMHLRQSRKYDRMQIQRRPEIYGELAGRYPAQGAYEDMADRPGMTPETIGLQVGSPVHGKVPVDGVSYLSAVSASPLELDGKMGLSVLWKHADSQRTSSSVQAVNLPWRVDSVSGEWISEGSVPDNGSVETRIYARRNRLDVMVRARRDSENPLRKLTPTLQVDLYGGLAQGFPDPGTVVFDGGSTRSALLSQLGSGGTTNTQIAGATTTVSASTRPIDTTGALVIESLGGGKQGVGLVWDQPARIQSVTTPVPGITLMPGSQQGPDPMTEEWHFRIYLSKMDMAALTSRMANDIRVMEARHRYRRWDQPAQGSVAKP